MKFWTPLETPREFCMSIEAAVARKNPPARVSAEVSSMPSHVVVAVSKMGTTAMEISLAAQPGEAGLYGEIVRLDVATFHRPFIDAVMVWVEKEVIEECGGRLISET